MPIYKCPKCSETFIETRQMMLCPSCFYKGKLIELSFPLFEDEEENYRKKERFNSRATIENVLSIIEKEKYFELDSKIDFQSDKLKSTQRKILSVFRQNGILLWKDLVEYSKKHDLRDLQGIGVYYYKSLAHLLCLRFSIKEVSGLGSGIKRKKHNKNAKKANRIKQAPRISSQVVTEEIMNDIELFILKYLEQDEVLLKQGTLVSLVISAYESQTLSRYIVLDAFKSLRRKKQIRREDGFVVITELGLKRIS